MSRLSLFAVTAWALLTAPLAAVTTLRCEVSTTAGPPAAALVSLNGVPTIRLRHEQSAVARQLAAEVVARVQEAAEAGPTPAQIRTAAAPGGEVAVLAGAVRLVTASVAQGKLARQTPDSLAQTWVAALRRAFATTYLSVPGSGLLIALGETATVAVRGYPAGGPFKCSGLASSLARVQPADDWSRLRVSGRAVGRGELTLQRGHARLTLPVAVKKRAGSLPGQISVEVTGREVPGTMLREAVWAQLMAVAKLEPGARMRFDVPDDPSLPPPGGRGQVALAVAIEGPDYLPFQSRVLANVQVSDWPDAPAEWLLVSNDPESVRGTRLLLRGRLRKEQRTRLLYHHLNATGQPLVLEVRLLNHHDRPARIHVRDAFAGPSPNPEVAGHVCARRYWQQRLAGQGYWLRLPPHTAWTITGVTCGLNETLSGLSEFWPAELDDLEVQVVATSGAPVRGPRGIAAAATAPFSDMFLFAKPDFSATYAYRPGGMYAFMNVGRDPLKSVLGPPLMGNYGAVYDLNLTFENSAEREQRFELVFSADGGAAIGTVVVNGRIYETKLVRGGEQERLLDLLLPPGGQQVYRIRTLPESGSNYPLRIVGRPYTVGWAGRGKP
ncbi:MAG: hypothetical protein IT204_03125 [Fimbriimonadaceae bacterium]|nr:hypothetical protein [Fimbriimonadaceae bacterium]